MWSLKTQVHHEHGSLPSCTPSCQGLFIYFCCYFVLFLLFWFDFLPERAMRVGLPVSKRTSWWAKRRLPSYSWATRQKLTSAVFWVSKQDGDRGTSHSSSGTHCIKNLLLNLIPWVKEFCLLGAGGKIILNCQYLMHMPKPTTNKDPRGPGRETAMGHQSTEARAWHVDWGKEVTWIMSQSTEGAEEGPVHSSNAAENPVGGHRQWTHLNKAPTQLRIEPLGMAEHCCQSQL
jgi:hypothetical protein